jgi:hypothetical protein
VSGRETGRDLREARGLSQDPSPKVHLELEELEENHDREMREESLLRPILIKPLESGPEAERESLTDQPSGEIPF